MAAELNTTKLITDNHILLDQPLLRLPHELVKRNFRNTQRYVERERDHILPSLKDTANASLTSKQTHEQTLASLDAMISRMQNFKRKLEKLQNEEEAIHSHTSKRIKHLQDLYTIPSVVDVKYDNWSRTRLDRLIVDYLLRSGYSNTASTLAQAKDITHLIDHDTFVSSHRIAASLARGETKECLAWINENRNNLKKLLVTPAPPSSSKPTTSSSNTNLEFELRLQQFIELVRTGKKFDAVLHAQTHLSPHAASRTDDLMSVAGLLAQDPDQPSGMAEPYKSLFSPQRWPFLSKLFIETHHTLLNLPVQPLLHVALSAGLSALKTPACHSAYNPASSASPAHQAKVVLMATNTSLCPICSMELNDLARSVPYAHHTTSSVEPDPVVLPNDRIYGRQRLEEGQRIFNLASPSHSSTGADKEGGKLGKYVRDPTTGEIFDWDQVRKVYIT